MSDHSTLDDIKHAWDLIGQHAPDGITLQEAAQIAAPVFHALSHISEALGRGTLDCSALKDGALEIYDNHVAGIDLTGKWYESLVDRVLRNVVEGAADALCRKLGA